MQVKKHYIWIAIAGILLICLCFFLLMRPTTVSAEVTEEEYMPEPTPTPCLHEWQDGVCALCGEACEHVEYMNGQCTRCGYICKHQPYVDGKCPVCGLECEHVFIEGVCYLCQYRCPHEKHDRDTQLCERCGLRVPHHYVDNVCACGHEFEALTGWGDYLWLDTCEQPGTLEEIRYQTPRYDRDPTKTYDKWMYVYTPYDYDPSLKYNVIFLYHGRGGSHLSWTATDEDIDGMYVTMKNIYDNMIAYDVCEPFILVSLDTGFLVDGWKMSDNSEEHNALELRNVVLPHIIQNYSTYAESSDIEDIKAAREHFGIGGFSNGSLFAYKSGMMRNFDIFGNYLFVSGDDSAHAVDYIMSDEWKDLPFKCVFCAGCYDSQYDHICHGYDRMIATTDRMVPDSTCFKIISDYGHDLRTPAIGIFNAMQLLF